MLSIGWVIFWKALIVTAWATATARWLSYKKRRKEAGLPLRKDRRGVYVVDDRLERYERIARRLFIGGLAIFILYGLVVVYLLVAT